MFSTADHTFMSRAIALAKRGWFSTLPNPRVGCVLVKDGVVVGEGWHERPGEPHAEVNALRAAGERARGATAYVTLEPCCHFGRTPPCADALIEAGVARVIAAMEDPNPKVAGGGLKKLRDAGIETASGLLEKAARELNPGFIKLMTTGRPRVRVKLAASLDGRTAMASGESKWITGETARHDVQRLRAEATGIVTGIGTVLADDPMLDVRLPEMTRQPERIVLDPALRMPAAARMFTGGGKVRVFAVEDDPGRREALTAAGAEVETLAAGNGRIPLAALLERLAALGHTDVLVEAGATLAGAFLQQGLADELVLYLAPSLLGHEARPLVALPGMERLDQRLDFALRDVRVVGGDLRLDLARREKEEGRREK